MAEFLLIASALLHALWNAQAKRASSPSLQVLGILIFSALFSLAFLPFFPGESFPNKWALIWAGAAGLFEAGYVISLAASLERSPLGLSYTIMRGGAMLTVWFLSVLFFDERFNYLTSIGVGVLFLGLFFTTYAKNWREVFSIWPYLCALFIAGYHIFYDLSLSRGSNPASLFSFSLWIALPALFIYHGKNKFQRLKQHFHLSPIMMMLGGLVCTLSFILFLMGLSITGAGLALSLRNSSVIFAQIFALMIGEKISWRQWFGAFLVALGCVLVNYSVS
ncbi:MAG: EamA family transporter [Bacteriovoracaceae bacterium]|nr:EamA family transporter [Bacteriovoracaceae bacterium]